MIPRFISMAENLKLLDKQCLESRLQKLILEEIEACLAGRYYSDELLNAACEMKAKSVNLWYQTVSAHFIDKAHQKGLSVLVYTVNTSDDWQRLSMMGVDGIFTDCYSEAARHFADNI